MATNRPELVVLSYYVISVYSILADKITGSVRTVRCAAVRSALGLCLAPGSNSQKIIEFEIG